MPRITLYLNPDCRKCHRIARVHKFFDWLGRIAVTTADSPLGPMRPGEIAVADARTGEVVQGVAAVRRIARNIPAYWPLLPVLYVPFVARAIDRDTRGCADGGCAVPGVRRA